MVRAKDIDIVIELIGGYTIAKDLVLEAIRNGKHVVTANKALLATHGNEIFAAAQKKGVMVAFEASVAGGIPIIKALREGLAANRIEWIAGIINGTSNFILSEMRDKGLPFATVLKDAQKRGYAEADPTFDIEGVDAAHKLTILSALAFGIPMQFSKAYTEGISKLTQEDIRYAEQLGYRIKLLGITKRKNKGIELRVHPTLIPTRRLIANVEGVMNAVLVKGDAVGATLYYGAGAGSQPTASAVVADLVDVTRLITADPGAPRAAPRIPARPPGEGPDPADRRSRDLLLPAHARAGPAGRAGRRHAHPRRFEDLDRRHGAEGARGGPEPRRHRDAHPPGDREERQRRDGEDRAAADGGRQGHAHPPRRAAVMRYVSTRGDAPAKRFTEILLEGLASDGGLYVPESYPEVDLSKLRGKSYPELAHAILSQFMDDLPDLKKSREKRIRRKSSAARDITPLKTLEPGLHLLGLSNGPTLAFKDVAMQLLGNAFEFVLQKEKKTLNILGATSGDTGSAAEYAMRGKKRINVFMLSPHGRMSAFQRAQMFSLQDANIHNLAVKGVFDDCQDVVKKVNADAAYKDKYRIGAVNSINWARVAAQVVYYFKGYFAATLTRFSIRSPSRCPPATSATSTPATSRAAWACRSGRLILATNENDVLDEFFRTGKYRVRKATVATSSPSMDISKASNFERYVFDLLERDGSRVKAFCNGGEFDLSVSQGQASSPAAAPTRIGFQP